MKVDINNLTKAKINTESIKKITQQIIVKEKKQDYSISIVFVDEKTITEINKKYRGKNKATDVLSFVDQEVKSFPEKEKTLGEVIICPSQIKKDEIIKVLIHGIVHLLGYDHEKNLKQEKAMKKKEQTILDEVSF